MKCPMCTESDLLMTERLSIEIDYCPQCRGVWLDRGELDKIIERSEREQAQVAVAPARQTQRPAQQTHDGHHGYSEKQHYENQGYRRKKSVWQELFD
jgi:uncharacterized protein